MREESGICFRLFREEIRKDCIHQFILLWVNDNGPEFSAADDIEQINRSFKRTNLFYCDANQSQQKGKIEKNHEYIRMYVPQGSSFDEFTQKDITLMMNESY